MGRMGSILPWRSNMEERLSDAKFEATARGSGYYRVRVDGVEVSKHTQPHKAQARAYTEKLAHPGSVVDYWPDFNVEVEMFGVGMGVGGVGGGGAIGADAVDVTPVENQAPTTPTMQAPGTPTETTCPISCDPFVDPDAGDGHAASQWQTTLSTDTGFASVVDDSMEDAVDLLDHIAGSDTPLTGGNTYISRVRHKDDQGNWSDYSAASASFTTEASGGVSPWFEDSFESGDFSKTQNGGGWASHNSGQGDPKPTVETTKPRTGTYSTLVRYTSRPDGSDNWVEIRGALGKRFTEIWFEFYLWVPSNYNHRNSSGADNNKFFQLYDTGVPTNDAFHVTVEQYPNNADGSSYCRRFLNRSRGVDGPPTSGKPGVATGPSDWISWVGSVNYTGNHIIRNQWNRVGFYFRSATARGVADGRAELWTNGNEAKTLDWEFWASAPGDTGNPGRLGGFTHFYIPGWSNSGYNDQTDFYYDDFKWWDTDPGWGKTG